MNDYEAKERAYQGQLAGQYANTLAQGAIGANYANATQGVQATVVADAMLRELSVLIEKACMVRNRQSNLKERIFGPQPPCPESAEKSGPLPSGFLHEANYKLQLLHAIMDGIIGNCTDLERLA